MLRGFKDKFSKVGNIHFGKIILALVIIFSILMGNVDTINAITPDWDYIAYKGFDTYPYGHVGGGFYSTGNWIFRMNVNENNEIVIDGSARSENSSSDPDEGRIITTTPYPTHNTGIQYNPNNDYAIVLQVRSERGTHTSENIYPNSVNVYRTYQVDMWSPNVTIYKKSKPNISPNLNITSPDENSYFSK